VAATATVAVEGVGGGEGASYDFIGNIMSYFFSVTPLRVNKFTIK
jgi:hypothetical protein